VIAKQICDRCHEEMEAHTMSRFNLQTICMACVEDERLAPGYKLAAEIELNAVRSGDRNFPGIGLGPEDRYFLAKRLRLRQVG
jgi:hypothetical protein